MAVQVHIFRTSGEAYDASQTHGDIHDGDVLSVPSERVVGILVEAWPTAISEASGAFHVPAPGLDWESVPTVSAYPATTPSKDYSASFDAAVEELDRVCLEIAEASWPS